MKPIDHPHFKLTRFGRSPLRPGASPSRLRRYLIGWWALTALLLPLLFVCFPGPSTLAQTTQRPSIDLLLVVDESGSMWQENDKEPEVEKITSPSKNPLPSGDGSRRIETIKLLVELLQLEKLKDTRVGILLFSQDVTLVTPDYLDKDNKPYQKLNGEQPNLTCQKPIFIDMSDQGKVRNLIGSLKQAHIDYFSQARNTWTDTRTALQIAQRVFDPASGCRSGITPTKVMTVITDGVPETAQFPSNDGKNDNWKKNYLPGVWQRLNEISTKKNPNTVSLFTVLVTPDAVTKQNLGLSDSEPNPWITATSGSYDPVPNTGCSQRYLYASTNIEIPEAASNLVACMTGSTPGVSKVVEKNSTEKISFFPNYQAVTLIINKLDRDSVVTIKRPDASGEPTIVVDAKDNYIFPAGSEPPKLDPYYQLFQFNQFKEDPVRGYYWKGNWSVSVNDKAQITFRPLIREDGYKLAFVKPRPELKSWPASRPMPLQLQVAYTNKEGKLVDPYDDKADSSYKLTKPAKNVQAKLVRAKAPETSLGVVVLQYNPTTKTYFTAPDQSIAIPKEVDENDPYQVVVTGDLDETGKTLSSNKRDLNIGPYYWLDVISPKPNSTPEVKDLKVQVQLHKGANQIAASSSLGDLGALNGSIKADLINDKGAPISSPQPCNPGATAFDCDLTLTLNIPNGNYNLRVGVYEKDGKLRELDDSVVLVPLTIKGGIIVVVPPTVAPTTAANLPPTLQPVVPATATAAPTPQPTPSPVSVEADLTGLWIFLLVLALLVAVIVAVIVLLPRLNTLQGVSISNDLNAGLVRTPLKGRSQSLTLNHRPYSGANDIQPGPTLTISASERPPKSLSLQLSGGPAAPVIIRGVPAPSTGAATTNDRETLVQVGATTYRILNPHVRSSGPSGPPPPNYQSGGYSGPDGNTEPVGLFNQQPANRYSTGANAAPNEQTVDLFNNPDGWTTEPLNGRPPAPAPGYNPGYPPPPPAGYNNGPGPNRGGNAPNGPGFRDARTESTTSDTTNPDIDLFNSSNPDNRR